MAPRSIGIIGLGLLGGELAGRLLETGFDVLGYDVDADRIAALSARGGRSGADAGLIAESCDTIVLSLPDSSVVTEVVADVSEKLRPGQMIVDTTTGDPEQMARTARDVANRGVAYVDATVLGSSAAVAAGEALLLVGGAEAEVARLRDVLDALSPAWHHLGPSGTGAKMKLVANLVLGLHRAALAEGLALAAALGIAPQAALDVLRQGVTYSRVMDTKGAKMIDRDYTPQARLSQHLKDVRLMLEAARRAGAELPLSEAHRRLLAKAIAAGYGDQDNSAIMEAY